MACWLAALVVLPTGCQLAANSVHGVCAEITRKIDDTKECKRNKLLAAAVWEDIQRTGHYSVDYGLGFKDGFVDFLDAGGNGSPPPVPPRRYLTFRFQTPEGYQAINDWFAGFRHGAAVAAESGYRQYIIAPSQLSPPVPNGPDAHSGDIIPSTHTPDLRPGFPPTPQPLVPQPLVPQPLVPSPVPGTPDKKPAPSTRAPLPLDDGPVYEVLPPLRERDTEAALPDADNPVLGPRIGL